jgi:hypothetical protein
MSEPTELGEMRGKNWWGNSKNVARNWKDKDHLLVIAKKILVIVPLKGEQRDLCFFITTHVIYNKIIN